MLKILWITLLCTLLVSCETQTPTPIASTNMADVIVSIEEEPDERYLVCAGETYPLAADEYPMFVNGSLCSTAFSYDGESDPMVSLHDLLLALCGGGFSELSVDGGVLTVRYAPVIEANAAVHANDLTTVRLIAGTNQVAVNTSTITLSAPVEFSVDPTTGYADVMLPYRDVSKLLGLEVSFYDRDAADAWEGHTQTDGAPYYLSGTPHLMFWSYPEDASEMSADEAIEQLRTYLIAAYETTYGTYEPYTEEEAAAVGGDRGQLNRMIQSLAVAGENDRFWRIPFVYDFLVDKYTGEVYTQYNGLVEVFSVFDPYAKGALAFPG